MSTPVHSAHAQGAGDPAILHVDLDAFYASVEQLADPAIAGRPVIVGGLGARGVVAAASYEARRFGVHSAMPMSRARRACPDGVFLSPRFDAYQAASRDVMAILRSYTPLVEPISLDEAFLDVRGARRRIGTGEVIALDIRARVLEETALTISVGVATTKFLAKLASALAKPDGLLVVAPGTELEFLHPLPVEHLWGVGPATRRLLRTIGVRTVGDLAALGEPTLIAAVGDARGRHLHALAHNIDERAVEPDRTVKSIGHEETFSVDRTDRAVLTREVVRLADRTAGRLRAAKQRGRTVQLKVRYADFRTITRSRTLGAPTDLAADIANTARALLDEVDVGEGIRLLGVSMQQLVAAELGPGVQTALDLDDSTDPLIDPLTVPLIDPPAVPPTVPNTQPRPDRRADRQAALERSIDDVRLRYGHDSVIPARIVDAPPGIDDARLEEEPPIDRTD